MTVVIHGEHQEIADYIQRRGERGLDGRDEMWRGEYHVAPVMHSGVIEAQILLALAENVHRKGFILTTAFNLGRAVTDFRVPAFGVFATQPDTRYVRTAELVGQVMENDPDFETFVRFDFYAKCQVKEILVVDQADKRLRLFRLDDDGKYEAAYRIEAADGLLTSELSLKIGWRWP